MSCHNFIMSSQIVGSFRIALLSAQLQQVRLGHRIRGKSPLVARSLKDRLEEINYKDEIYTARIDIGLPSVRKTGSDVRKERMTHIKNLKSDTKLEKLARDHKLLIDINLARQEWLKTDGPKHKKQLAEHYGIFEHLFKEGFFIPRVNLEVYYNQNNETSLPVYSGNVIKPKESLELPEVNFEAENDSLWTLVLTSLDSHLTEGEKEYCHWMVANIPSGEVEKGESLVKYLQPIPLRGTGYHRYVFVLYKQDQPMKYDIQKIDNTSDLESRTFVSREWYKQHQDNITPAGLAFFQTDWDDSVSAYFHDVLNTKEPVYEYDFPQPYIRPQEWFPKGRPFNLYMDKYRDPKKINQEYLLRKLAKEDPFKKPEPPLKFPNAQPLPREMPSWLKLHEKKIRLRWGRVNDV